MKKLLVLLFSILILPLSVNASDVYYCSDDDITGFDVSDNFDVDRFKTEKFKIMIDFDNKNVTSNKIDFTSSYNQKCFLNINDDTLYCMNDVGTSFSINKLNLRYFRSDIYNQKDLINDIFLAYGTCEKF